MSQDFEVVPYALRARRALNATTARRSYVGALVRSQGGHGCVHPWPERGDGSLEEELAALATGTETRLTQATRRCLVLDGEARRAGRWLFAERPKPPDSHAILGGADVEAARGAARRGFGAVKVKGSPERLQDLGELLAESPLPVRLDFNETMTSEALRRWHGQLPERACAKVDFLEDPCPYDPGVWTELSAATGWRLALDGQAARAAGGFHVLVLKPAVGAVDDFEAWFDGSCDLLVTSYMDHPFGQLYAAFEAARLSARHPGVRLSGGLVTHRLFEDLPGALDLGEGPALRLPRGTGLGLDDYLEALPWEGLRT